MATDRAMSSPNHVLALLGAPPITPTDRAHQSCSTSQRSASSSLGNLSHTHHRKQLLRTHGHLHTLAFFLIAGRAFLG